MQALILGSAAGGGVPQWNCRCPVCALVWAGDPRVVPRTQSSLAVSADQEHWLLINASPDLRQQIARNAVLQPKAGLRHTPIKAVLLTNGDVDHVAGLLSLREGQPFNLFSTSHVLDSLAGNSIFNVLSPSLVERSAVALHVAFEPVPGLQVTLFPVPGKVPLWLETGEPVIGEETETTVGVILEAAGRRIAFIPGCALMTEAVRQQLQRVDALLFDGTVFRDDDLIRAGVGRKSGRRMGHMPMTGENGSIQALADLAISQKIFVHLNNTNPVLVEGSIERNLVEQSGWQVAYDTMRVVL